jgi:excisionase family DNA binding protein
MREITDLLDADEAAALLKVKRGTAYDWAAKGLLPHVRILAGTTRPVVRFRREDIERFIEQRTVSSESRLSRDEAKR